MDYLIFARKFRPQNFDEVIGQEPIVTTLKNAIRQERVSQNFLFAGPRGIGKTSTARILAKALNCAKGPTENPCGKCIACLEITNGNSMDVLEIDGASNRGIDEIRNLRETVKFKPVNGRFKIYIIDEVHMLTNEAFNALLKTLEEPPPHVKFIFATTESHKVPLTILSRCQRFNFKRIPTHEIATKLEEIAKMEKLQFEKNALFLIAKTSEGALRDAEGLLDQLASFSEKKIKEEDVLLMLGLTSEELFFSVLSALSAKDAQKIFSLVADLYDGGKDLVQFAKGLLEIFRHLLLLQCSDAVSKFIEMSEDGVRELEKRKNDFSRGQLLLALSILSNLQNQLRRNLAPPRLLVETALLKLLHLDGLQSVEDLAMIKNSFAPPSASKDSGFKAQASLAQVVEEKSQVQTVSAPAVLTDLEALWPRVIEYVKSKRMSTGIFLSESAPIESSETEIVLGLPLEFQFHKDMLEKNSNRQLVEEAFEVVSGRKVRVRFVILKPDTESKPFPVPPESAPAAKTDPEDHSQLSEILTQTLHIFEGARIVRKE